MLFLFVISLLVLFLFPWTTLLKRMFPRLSVNSRSVLALSSEFDLLHSHVQEWEQFWESSFNIHVRGNLELSRIIHASVYGIVSALVSKRSSQPHDELFYGLSPTGLGRGGGAELSDYEGEICGCFPWCGE